MWPYKSDETCDVEVLENARALIKHLGFALKCEQVARDALLEDMPKWISVKDELPPRERNILAVNGHGRIKILAFWKKEEKRWTWIEDSRFTHWNDITHWMPLPEPPDDEQNKTKED